MGKLLRYIYEHYFSKRAVPYWIILLIDSLAVLLSAALALYLEKGLLWANLHFWPIVGGVVLILVLFFVNFKFFHTYSGVVRFSSFVDLKNVMVANLSSSICLYLVCLAVDFLQIKFIVLPDIYGILTIFVISTLLMFVFRLNVKILYETIRNDSKAERVFIYGVRTGAVALAKSIKNEDPARYTLVGFVNPDEFLDSKYLMGVQIRRDGPHLIEKMQKMRVSALLVSPLQTEYFRSRDELISNLIEAGIKIIMMPNPEEWDGHSDIFREKLKEVEIEDLLPRQRIDVDLKAIEEQLRGKSVLITGAAGSIGSEIVAQVAKFHPSDMILVDQAETPMHDIRMMMKRLYGEDCHDESKRVKAATIVASITDEDFMEKLFAAHRPEYVFHAAAYKHVPMMEDNPSIAIRNNIRGTRIIADLSVKYGVRKFVMISTDKAVNPTNVMGCSKRICEIYCQSLNKAIQEGKVEGVTQFVTTRFGNVLGSNGSVIPIFREQIASGGPVTVTDPNIIRYFMLIPEACKLVLEAGVMGHGGEIFVFDMGRPIKIVELAKRMIILSGAKNIEIKFTGLRDGEKLYEEVLADNENTKPTVHPKIMVASVREYDYSLACENEERLLDASYRLSRKEIVKMMEEIVPEYRSTNEHYQ
ncbi:MAG: polysaccharide biosynthesis protein [Alistipes sp.]|nr:polysaccharide biosynthesis protein [Candidatus Minthomonas equi]